MKKKMYLINVLLVFFALCYSQENTATRNIFINGGYRVNGGNGIASIGYESSEIWQKLSVYSSLNFVDRRATVLNAIVREKDYFVEAGVKKTLPLSAKIYSFGGIGAIAGKHYLEKTESISAQNSVVYGGSAFVGADLFFAKNVALSLSSRYTYIGSRHDIGVMGGLKFYF